ncbi:DUF4964 domain-containing protein [Flavisolibacter nicotianae]|uniref:DUF4964 domain-containing protein n=1 Tax=Flavisolibacter nicotianae TaxID=2364882 RepID=UPI000EAE3346|nr:DUF4964 domain-containing protein [Flavisolibacter nicotianae]
MTKLCPQFLTLWLLGIFFPANAQVKRALAYPLITHNPYSSIRSNTDELAAPSTRHWTGKVQSLMGWINVDGNVYRFLGKDPDRYRPIAPTSDLESYTVRYTELPHPGAAERLARDNQRTTGRLPGKKWWAVISPNCSSKNKKNRRRGRKVQLTPAWTVCGRLPAKENRGRKAARHRMHFPFLGSSIDTKTSGLLIRL